MRFLSIDARIVDDGAIANGAGVLFILAAVVYGVLVFAETRYADSNKGSIVNLGTDDLPFVENNTFSQSNGSCRSDGFDELNKLVGRSRYDNETMNTQVCGYGGRTVGVD